jgi:hypothetical protein
MEVVPAAQVDKEIVSMAVVVVAPADTLELAELEQRMHRQAPEQVVVAQAAVSVFTVVALAC